MKTRVTKISFLAGVLASLFLLTACYGANSVVHSNVAYDSQTVTTDYTKSVYENHDNVTLSDMTYTRPDIDGMRSAMEDLQNGIANGKPAEDMIAAYETLKKQYDHADSMLSLVYLLYALDVTDEVNRGEYAYLQSALSELDGDMQSVSLDLFESSGEAQKLAVESFGEGYVDAIIGDEGYDDSVQSLLDREEQLTLEYDNLSATFTLLDNGKRWTYADIVNDLSLDYEEYQRLYNAYCDALNEQAGDIFLEQLPIRQQIASRLGYDHYADYCYQSYGRDYSPDDAKALHAAVKKYIVPLFVESYDKHDTSDLKAAEFSQDAFFSELTSAANAFSPMLSDPVGYMMKNRLYDFSDKPEKMDSSFTTYISDYSAPFIFSRWTGYADDIATVLHELGHFTSYYHNAVVGYSANDNLDLAEVDSQALVLLLFDDYKSFYGKYAEEARISALMDAMYSLLSGCMEDEFQQEIYSKADITLDEINALYYRLSQEYGLQEAYNYRGTEWVLVSHTFQAPLYYISYAASMVPSLELFYLAQSDEAAAKTAYFNIVMRDQYASLGEVMEKNGLNSVFSEQTIAQIAVILKQYI